MRLKTPYLLFLGEATGELEIKTASGLAYWRPKQCVGEWTLPGCEVSTGLPNISPAQAKAQGAQSLVIGTAPAGGSLNPGWIPALVQALESGLDIVSGLHIPLSSVTELSETAGMFGRSLVDVRVPPGNIPVGNGKPRSGKRLLTVGTDCCVGKKYTALAIHKAMQDAGLDCTFRATGQTGIMIAGDGMPVDAVVADFLPGAAEILSPDNEPGHWDVIEGQGSLFHPAYAAVTLGLVHGSQADALVICHEAGRDEIDDHPGFLIPTLHHCIERYIDAASLTNPAARCIGMSINTSRMAKEEGLSFLQQLSKKSGLPCVDPVLTGVKPLLQAVEKI